MPDVERYGIPLPSGGMVALEGPFPIPEPDWDYLLGVLEAMRPGLLLKVNTTQPRDPAK